MNNTNQVITLKQQIIFSVWLILLSFNSVGLEITSNNQKSHKVFKGEVFHAWKSLHQYSPKQEQLLKVEKVYPNQFNGGIKNGFQLKPHWANDLASDTKYRQQLRLYEQASKALDQGKLDQSIKHLNKFLLINKQSLLKPIVIYAKAIAHLGLRQDLLGLDALHRFSVEFPNHPLMKNVSKMMDTIK